MEFSIFFSWLHWLWWQIVLLSYLSLRTLVKSEIFFVEWRKQIMKWQSYNNHLSASPSSFNLGASFRQRLWSGGLGKWMMAVICTYWPHTPELPTYQFLLMSNTLFKRDGPSQHHKFEIWSLEVLVRERLQKNFYGKDLSNEQAHWKVQIGFQPFALLGWDGLSTIQ